MQNKNFDFFDESPIDEGAEIINDIINDKDNADDLNLDFIVDDPCRSNLKFKKRNDNKGFNGLINKLNWNKKKTIIASVIAIVVVLSLLFTWTYFTYLNYNHDNGFGDIPAGELITNPEVSVAGIINIALFGIDSRSTTDFEGNSDSIMILSINANNHTVKVISIMRDSLVPMDGYDPFKINAAYARGGPTLAVKTINKIFGLDISDYATVNFTGMSKIVDAVGGIEVDITEAERIDANEHLQWQAIVEKISPIPYIQKAGPQLMSGIQAVSYARVRYASTPDGESNDFGRTDRQRYVMEQLFDKAIKLSASKYPGLVKALLPYTKTSLDLGEIIDLASVLLQSDVQFQQARIPDPEYIIDEDFLTSGGSSTVYYDLDFAGEIIRAFIFNEIHPASYIETNEIKKNKWYDKKSGTGQGDKNQSTTGSSKSSGDKITSSSSKTASSTTSSGKVSSGGSSSGGSTTSSTGGNSSGNTSNTGSGTTSAPQTPSEGNPTTSGSSG